MTAALAEKPLETTAPPDQERTPRRPWLGPGAAVVLPVAVYVLHALRYGRWIIDDAGITFAYARNIAAGHGIVQQPGADPVEGFSNPLWTAVLVVLKKLTLFDSGRTVAGWPDYVLVPRALGVGCLVATLVLLHRAFVPLVGGRAWLATLLTGLGLAANPSYVIWSISGLENPLYGLLIGALVAVLARATAAGTLPAPRTAVTVGGLVLSLALTRPDGLIYVAAYPLLLAAVLARAEILAGLRSAGLALAVTAVPAGVLLLARQAIFGNWVANTTVVKGSVLVTMAELAKIDGLGMRLGWPLALTAVTVVGLAIGTAVGRSTLWPGVLGPAGCLLLALAAFALLPTDWMVQFRFATPIWVAGTALVAVCGVALLGGGALSLRALTALVLVATASTAFAVVGLRDGAQRFRAKPTVPLCWVVDRFGRQFNTYADRYGVTDGTLAAADLGGTLLTSRLRVTDLAGLTDPTIARARGIRARGGEVDERAIGDYILGTVRPTFIHFHSLWGDGLRDDPRLARLYVAIIPGHDYVRRDVAARRPGVADALRAEAHAHRGPGRMASCGDRLTVGST